MNKIAFDLYNCQSNILSDFEKLYDVCVDLGKQLNLTFYFKPTIVPYFYGKEKMDEGVSCFCLIKENCGGGLALLRSIHSIKGI